MVKQICNTGDDVIASVKPNPRLTDGPQKWRDLERAVAKGGVTLGEAIRRFGPGYNGLQVVARHVRKGCYSVDGVLPDAMPREDHQADIRVAQLLERLPGGTRILQVNKPPHRKTSEPELDEV